MFCPECGKEIPEGSTTCPNCETVNNNVEPKQEAPKASHNPIAENIGNTVNVKKSKKPLAIIISLFLVLIIALVGFGTYYLISSNSPKKVFSTLIDNTFKALEKDYKDAKDLTTQNTTMKLQFGLDTETEELEEIAKILEQLEIEFNVQIDYEEKLATVNLDSSLDKEELLKLQCYMDTEKQEAYIYSEELFDKYLRTDIDKEISELLKESFENSSNTENTLKALEVAKNELKKLLPEDNFSKENEKLEINNKTVKVTKNTLKLSDKETLELLKEYCEALLDDEDFIDYLNSDIEESLEDIVEELEDSLEDFEKSKDNKLEISIYTKGLKNSFVKFDAYIYSADTKMGFEIVKQDDGDYNYKLVEKEDDEKIELTGSYKIVEKNEDESEITISLNIPDAGEITLKISATNIINKELDKINTSNSVDMDNLTDAELDEIEENIENMKIYKLMESYLYDLDGDLGRTDNALSQYEESAQKTQEQIDELEDKINSYYNELENEDATDSTSSSSKIKENQLISYDNDILLEFNLPTGYKSEFYISDTHKTFVKNNSSNYVDTHITYDTKESQLTELQNLVKHYEEDDCCKNIKLSETAELEVNGRTFYYNIISYTYATIYGSTDYKEFYYYAPITDEFLYLVEFEDELPEEDLKSFLTITVSDYNG